MHHVSEFVAIGKAFVPADTQNAEFTQTNTKFMEIRANLIHSLSLLMEHDNPTIIFPWMDFPSDYILILYMCICLCMNTLMESGLCYGSAFTKCG